MYLSHLAITSGFRMVSRKIHQLPQLSVDMPSSYKEAIDTLNRLQSNVEYIKHAKIQNNQENNMAEMQKFLKRSGMSLERLDTLPVIHVAGTNGKGTTCSYCESVLRHHGYKTGFYSSPHLLEVRERIRLDGAPITKDKFSEYFWKIYCRLDRAKSASYDMPLYFRFLTLMALHVFVSEKVDVAILEVGIGGEYDCTNLVRKTLVAGITPLDIDHTVLLGNTIESIAWNKAGIMKPNTQVFTASQPEAALKVLQDRSIEKKATLEIIKNLYINQEVSSGIPMHVTKTNASLALAISKAFMSIANNNNNNLSKYREFNMALAKKCIETARWPGRYEIICRNNFAFYLDGAHTVDSMQVCSDWFLSKTNGTTTGRGRVLVFNITGERNPENLLKSLVKCKFDSAIFIPNVGDDNANADQEDQIQPIKRQLERCHANKQIWGKLDEKCSTAEVFTSFAKAVGYLRNRSDEQRDILITGSIHLIGAAMSVLDPTLGGSL